MSPGDLVTAETLAALLEETGCGWIDPGAGDEPVPGYPGFFVPAGMPEAGRAAFLADLRSIPYPARLRMSLTLNGVHAYEYGHRHDAHLQPCYRAWGIVD